MAVSSSTVGGVLLIPIPFAFWKWLETRSTVYTLTDQRLKFSRGVHSPSRPLSSPAGWITLVGQTRMQDILLERAPTDTSQPRKPAP